MAKERVAFVSLGCAKNLVNTEQMMALAADAGYQVTGDPEGAEVAVVNTCGFIDSAKSEAIDVILTLARQKETGRLKKILVAGCMVQRHGTEVQDALPEVDGLLGCGSYEEITRAIERALEGETPRLFGNIDAPLQETRRILTTPPWMAYLRIAEGCDNHCAYCVIPSLRGKYRSREMEAVLQEARWLAQKGVKELLVIAQDITRFGTDRNGKRQLAALLRELCKIEGFHWIRLHYLYPDEIDDELIEVIVREEKIVKYLDIPLQHIDDKILRAMNRRGTGEEVRTLLHKLRKRIPNLVLRTSLICGLPGEGEAEFEALCRFLEEEQIERAGVFAFSPQEGTKAAEMEHIPDEETVAARMDRLLDIQTRCLDAHNASQLGRTVEVLVEGRDELGRLYGRTWADSPDIDGRLILQQGEQDAQSERPLGTFVWVTVTGSEDGDLLGVPAALNPTEGKGESI